MKWELGVAKPQLKLTLQPISTDRTEIAPGSNVVGKYLESGLAHGP